MRLMAICTLYFAGKIIGVSEPSRRTGINVEDILCLTADELKTKAIETYSESDVRHVVEEIPQFYNFKSTVFTNVGK